MRDTGTLLGAAAMWQEQLDYFWDGRRRLIIGGFDGAARVALTIVSARDPAFQSEAALVDVIDAARWRLGAAVTDLPADHRFVRLTAADGTGLTLHLGSEREQPPEGDYRLLMTLLGDGATDAPQFRLAALPARGDVERLAREQTAAAGPRLVWAFGQRRAFEQAASGDLVARLSPARRIFPAYESRLLIETRPLETEAAADTREAPFAIMQHWLRENGAPRAALRLRIPDSLEESAGLLGRTCVALALNQRRRLRGWVQEQKQAGEPIIDLLGVEDIRQATGEAGETPDAVDSSEPVVVANLLNLLLDPETPEADGVAARRAPERGGAGLGETVEIDFYGAALGDDIGLVAPAARPGDLGVAAVDPGGPPFARLFRIEADGLVPRRLAEDDPLLDELLRRAAGAGARMGTGAAARAFAERAAGLKGRREKFVAAHNDALARAGLPPRFSATGLWDMFEPLLQASFAALVTEAAPQARASLQAAGGYGAYVADPALTAALARAGPLARATAAPTIADDGRGAALSTRYAAACAAAGMTAPGMPPAEQLAALRALMEEGDAVTLRAAGVGLSPDPALRAESAAAARWLEYLSAIERAIAHFVATRDADSAAALTDYLTARRAGRWIAPASAIGLAALVERAGVEREEAQNRLAAGMAAAAPTPPPAAPAPVPEKPKGLLRRLFGG